MIMENTSRKTITISAVVHAPIETVWNCWTAPEHIMNWAFASDDWEAPKAENDVRVGGRFLTTMAAKDGSFSFDFTGTYTSVDEHAVIEYDIDDGRHVSVKFDEQPDGVHVTETFAMEGENTEEKQREGWQAILNNFAKYTELQ